MASIDKAAIVFSIAIVAVGVGFAFYGESAQNNYSEDTVKTPPVKEPAPTKPEEEKPTACTMEYVPVCGVDGITYGNRCMLNAAEVELDYQGECKAPETTPEPQTTPQPETTPEEATTPTGTEPKTVSVTIPEGTSSPGCEATDECYLPATVSVIVGDSVEWINIDTAAHTVTSGSPADGPSGVFDSSLLMAKASFTHTFETVGSYDYFCMVHPWMVGKVQVD